MKDSFAALSSKIPLEMLIFRFKMILCPSLLQLARNVLIPHLVAASSFMPIPELREIRYGTMHETLDGMN